MTTGGEMWGGIGGGGRVAGRKGFVAFGPSLSRSLSLSLDGLPHVGFAYDGPVVVVETYDRRPVVGLKQGYVLFRLCCC